MLTKWLHPTILSRNSSSRNLLYMLRECHLCPKLFIAAPCVMEKWWLPRVNWGGGTGFIYLFIDCSDLWTTWLYMEPNKNNFTKITKRAGNTAHWQNIAQSWVLSPAPQTRENKRSCVICRCDFHRQFPSLIRELTPKDSWCCSRQSVSLAQWEKGKTKWVQTHAGLYIKNIYLCPVCTKAQVRGQLSGVGPLLPPRRSWGSSTDVEPDSEHTHPLSHPIAPQPPPPFWKLHIQVF